jgi:hypothetical protein
MPTPVTPSRSSTVAWAAALGLATLAGTLATACMTPFVALAVMAASTMPRSRAVITVAAVWLTNQVLGFTLEHYPLTSSTFAWGASIGFAAVAVAMVANLMTDRGRLSAMRTLGAFAVGFVIYEVILFAVAHVAGGLATFTPSIIALIGRNEAEWLVGLFAIHLLLTSRAPRWFGPMPTLRLA